MSPSTSAPAGAPVVPPTIPGAPTTGAADGAPTRRSGRPVLLLGVLLVAVAAAAYLYLPMLGVDLPAATLVAVPAGLAVLVLLVLVLRPRLRRRPRSQDADEAPAPAPTEADDAADDLVPTMDPRALLLYARSLEGTLNDQEDRLEQVRRAADDRRQADVRQEHVRSRATVELMRRVHAQQPGVVALGRTEAAVARLGVEPGFTRPMLPSGPAGTIPVVFGVAPVPAQEPDPADTAAGPATDATPGADGDVPTRPLPGHGSLADREAALASPSEPVPVELTAAGRPKVRPVPPPPDTAPTRRGRRHRRGAQG